MTATLTSTSTAAARAGLAPDPDSLSRYLDEIGRHPVLTRPEELALARLAADGDAAARRRLVECNLRLVVLLARRYRGLGLDFLDLIQEGNLGLVAAVETYDWRREVRFASYADTCIRHEICRALSLRSRLVRPPVRVAQSSLRVRAAERRLTQELGREPSNAEVARAAALDEAVVADVRRAELVPTSLSAPVGDGETTMEELLADGDEHDPARIVEDAEAPLAAALAHLDARSRTVIELRFGLRGEPRTVAEVAAELGVSPARVRLVEVRTLRGLAGVDELRDLRPAA